VKQALAFAAIAMLLLFMGRASAWGVAYEKNHLVLQRGESWQFYTSLQNAAGNTSYEIAVTLKDEAGIASLAQSTYSLPAGTARLPVYVLLRIPSDKAAGEYVVDLTYAAKPPAGTGQIGLGQEKGVRIFVTVPEAVQPPSQPQPSSNGGSTHRAAIPNATVNQTVISYPAAQPPANQPAASEQPVEPQAVVAQPPVEQDLVGSFATTPVRLPFELFVAVVVVLLVAYMLLPPKQVVNYGYMPAS